MGKGGWGMRLKDDAHITFKYCKAQKVFILSSIREPISFLNLRIQKEHFCKNKEGKIDRYHFYPFPMHPFLLKKFLQVITVFHYSVSKKSQKPKD